jgi:hydrogenase large subunit
MATRVVVDPVTRIEGHLRIEAVVENGVITDAFSAGTMVRGLEKILMGRDPRDAWAITERVCGVCTTVHALASVRSVEDALGISVPPTAELIRNIMLTTQYVQDHVIHFYHLHALDWVDIVNALKADPKKAAELAQSFSSGTRTRRRISPRCRTRSRRLRRADWASSPTAIGAIRPTSCRRK